MTIYENATKLNKTTHQFISGGDLSKLLVAHILHTHTHTYKCRRRKNSINKSFEYAYA